jgi:hypothetical protein
MADQEQTQFALERARAGEEEKRERQQEAQAALNEKQEELAPLETIGSTFVETPLKNILRKGQSALAKRGEGFAKDLINSATTKGEKALSALKAKTIGESSLADRTESLRNSFQRLRSSIGGRPIAGIAGAGPPDIAPAPRAGQAGLRSAFDVSPLSEGISDSTSKVLRDFRATAGEVGDPFSTPRTIAQSVGQTIPKTDAALAQQIKTKATESIKNTEGAEKLAAKVAGGAAGEGIDDAAGAIGAATAEEGGANPILDIADLAIGLGSLFGLAHKDVAAPVPFTPDVPSIQHGI